MGFVVAFPLPWVDKEKVGGGGGFLSLQPRQLTGVGEICKYATAAVIGEICHAGILLVLGMIVSLPCRCDVGTNHVTTTRPRRWVSSTTHGGTPCYRRHSCVLRSAGVARPPCSYRSPQPGCRTIGVTSLDHSRTCAVPDLFPPGPYSLLGGVWGTV